jgi:four helix bundle protein
MGYKGYKDLECYKKAGELWMYESVLAKKFPPHEKFLLPAQLINSSRSVTRNIAEGYGRYTYSDTKHFFVLGRGSVTETMESLTTAFDENYITEEEMKTGDEKCEPVFKLINGYIAYLGKSNKPPAQLDIKPNS